MVWVNIVDQNTILETIKRIEQDLAGLRRMLNMLGNRSRQQGVIEIGDTVEIQGRVERVGNVPMRREKVLNIDLATQKVLVRTHFVDGVPQDSVHAFSDVRIVMDENEDE